MKKILPFDCDSPIKTYPYFADYLGALKANGCEIDNLIEKNFLFLSYIPITGQVNFQHKSRLKMLMKCQSFDANSIDAVAFIKENINKDRYIVILLDDNYFNIKLKRNLGVHNWLVYGIDDETQLVYIAGYVFDNSCGMYTKLKISYDELLNSVAKKVTVIEKNRISSNHVFSIPKDIDINNKMKYSSLEKMNFYFISLNIFRLLILHNYIFSNIKVKPYKRSFLDLRDLRIVYEQSKVFKNILYKKTKSSFESKLNELTQLSESLLIEAAVFHYKSEPKSKIKYSKSINRKIYEIYKIEKELYKYIFV